jgi:ABC-type transporter Mla subunit MlaD
MKNRNFSDWAVALAVIACSVGLFLALAFALGGATFGKSSRLLRINFHDITGIGIGSPVKYAGAIAGKISGVRMLTAGERAGSGDTLNAIQVTVSLNSGVPPLPADVLASIAADTLLSDKFVLLSGGSSTAELSPDAVLQGIPPATFDKLSRDIDDALAGLSKTVGGAKGEVGDIFERIGAVLKKAQMLLDEAEPVVQNAKALTADARQLVAEDVKALTTDARQLISENKAPLSNAISQLGSSASAFATLANSGNKLIDGNEKKISSAMSDLKVTSENLKVTSTYSKILIRSLSQRPSQLIWGTSKPPALPSEQEILRSPRPLPVN